MSDMENKNGGCIQIVLGDTVSHHPLIFQSVMIISWAKLRYAQYPKLVKNISKLYLESYLHIHVCEMYEYYTIYHLRI